MTPTQCMTPIQKLHHGKHLFRVFLIFILPAAMLFVSACDQNAFEFAEDDSNYEAKLESAKIQIDNSDYETAYNTLLDLEDSHPDDSKVREYLSNACAGMVGIDTYNVLEVADELSDSGVDNGIDLVGRVLGNEDFQLTADEVGAKQNRLSDCAIENIALIDDKTDDQIVQQGLLSINNAVLTIADIVMEDQSLDEIELTKNGIKKLYSDSDMAFTAEPDPKDLESLSQDIVRIYHSVEKVIEIIQDEADANDLSETFDEFTRAIDNQAPYGEINSQELIDYINNFE